MSLDYDLEHQVRFNSSSEYKSLYTWNIDEIDENEKVVNKALIPWEWGVMFKTTKVNYNSSYHHETSTKYESINCDLKVIGIDTPRLEMFGTSREIKNIRLEINRSTDTEDNIEGIFAMGTPQYESEIDFRSFTTPDSLWFNLYLVAEKYEELKQLVIQNRLTSVDLNITKCEGLYAKWTPQVSTSLIKVLTNEHIPLEVPEESKDINIPMLGEVKEYKFSYSIERDLIVTSEDEDDIDDEDEDMAELFENEPVRTREQHIQEKTNAELKLINTSLNTYKKFGWAIVVLLFILIIAL